MRSNIDQENDFVVPGFLTDEFKYDSTIVCNTASPQPFEFPLEFVRIKQWMEGIAGEKFESENI
jgi:hypothetical protein